MRKPDDIPQDVWDAAVDVLNDWNKGPVTSETIARAILAAEKRGEKREYKRAIDEIDMLVESLMEGLMTDAGLTAADRSAMNHQINALGALSDAFRKVGD